MHETFFIAIPGGKPRSFPAGQPMFCLVCVEADNAKGQPRETLLAAGYARERVGQDFVCSRCGSTVHVLTDAEVKAAFPPQPPQTKRCWECGCSFTYAECRANGGDWTENGGYCGC